MGAQACKLKIILDGATAAGYAQGLTDTARALSDKDTAKLTDDVAYPIVEQLIRAEEALELAHNLLLDAVEYTGPRPGGSYNRA
jgi:hypothetical protein